MRSSHRLNAIVFALIVVTSLGSYVNAQTPTQVATDFWRAVLADDEAAVLKLSSAETDADKEIIRAVIKAHKAATELSTLLQERFKLSQDQVDSDELNYSPAFCKDVMLGFQSAPQETIHDDRASVTSERPSQNFNLALAKRSGDWRVSAASFTARPYETTAAAAEHIMRLTKQGWFKSAKEACDLLGTENNLRQVEGRWVADIRPGPDANPKNPPPGMTFRFFRDEKHRDKMKCEWSTTRGGQVMATGEVAFESHKISVDFFPGRENEQLFELSSDWRHLITDLGYGPITCDLVKADR